MNSRRNLDGKAVGLMVFLCAILGLQQIAIKAAAPDMAPVLQMAIRSGVSALLVAIYLRSKGMGMMPGNGKWVAGLVAGLLFTLEYFFVAEGLRFTNASRMVVMLYTAPAFAALGLHFIIPEERLHPGQWAGMALAFCGMVVAFYDSGSSLQGYSGEMLWGDFLGLLAGISWGTTTVVIRAKLSATPAAQTGFVQLVTCFCLLLPGAALMDRFDFTLSAVVWASLLFQTLIVCMVGIMLWFWLLTIYPASKLGVLMYLTPVFGIAFGVLLLDETVEPKFIAGAVLILAGVVLVSGWQWFSRLMPQRKDAASGCP